MIAGFEQLLERHKIPFVIVGGQAIARKVPTATQDIDLLVLVDDMNATAEALAKDPVVRFVDPPSSGMAGGEARIAGVNIDFDLLSPASYSGGRPGRDFFVYVRRYGSEGRFATPPVVWYMRLVAGDRAIYGSKIATDIRNGAPVEWLDGTRAIARRFGTLSRVDEGVVFVRQLLGIAGPLRARNSNDPKAPGSLPPARE
ncbi:MAG TPA: hypothetical protein VKT21_04395 [Thermoplasmata archaeon]|nr:hypothetical protein [Thermoplasmata archaeon]